ncbi:MAG: YicC/YloC family endoribonuclease, partial [Pseudomonadales bacterium]
MIHSMTAFASQTGTRGATSWVWEMRGVNARGLDARVRIPDGLDGLEIAARAALKKHVHRGNVTLKLRLSHQEGTALMTLDPTQLDAVLKALDAVQERAFDMGVT